MPTLYIKASPSNIYDSSGNLIGSKVLYTSADPALDVQVGNNQPVEYPYTIGPTNPFTATYPDFATARVNIEGPIVQYMSAVLGTFNYFTNNYYTDVFVIETGYREYIEFLSKQSQAATLTDLSGITIAPDVLTMMGDPAGKAGMASAIGASLALDSMAFQPTTNYSTSAQVNTALSNKVDKVSGKGLSTEDYTSAEKTKLAGLSAPVARSFTNPTVSLNTAGQISGTRDALVTYSVDISCTMSLTSGQSGLVVLEYADDSGFTTNVKTVSRSPSANSGALTIGLALTNLGSGLVSGVIPAGKYRRVRTVNTTGTPTFTMQNSQEVLL